MDPMRMILGRYLASQASPTPTEPIIPEDSRDRSPELYPEGLVSSPPPREGEPNLLEGQVAGNLLQRLLGRVLAVNQAPQGATASPGEYGEFMRSQNPNYDAVMAEMNANRAAAGQAQLTESPGMAGAGGSARDAILEGLLTQRQIEAMRRQQGLGGGGNPFAR